MQRGQRVSAVNCVSLWLPGDKLTPGIASEAAFGCYWQAIMGNWKLQNTGMYQYTPTSVMHLASRVSPGSGEVPAFLTQCFLGGDCFAKDISSRGHMDDLQLSLGHKTRTIFKKILNTFERLPKDSECFLNAHNK